ncbi:MAG: MFS transporter, partial [Gordonia sp. (in: high G+C Gram-positive bacteria)]|uniref:MFS transporter n=1 Tax=Gordonia sp. (in: high G+C Gram-positive bacteria) TaxID=84139 RepID=UPI003BB67247
TATALAGRAAHRSRRSAGHSARDGFTALRTNHRYRILLSVFVIQSLATAVMLAGAQYLATYVLDDKTALTPLFAALVAPALLVMPLWVRIGKRYGKQRALAVASALFMLAALSLAIAIIAPGTWIFLPVAVCGIGYAGMQTFPLAMLPDVIDEQSARTGRDQGGALAGLWTAAETLGMALGPGMFLLVLAATGFVSSTSDVVARQPHSAVIGITAGFALLPAILIAASLALLTRYEKGADR